MTRARLQELLGCFQNLNIAVAGDLFIDRWYEIDEQLNEFSLETGITAYQVVRKRSQAGAAGTILNNLSALGVGKLEAISMVGADGDGWEMLKCLQKCGVDTRQVIVSDLVVTPAYIKPQFPKEGSRFDIKNFTPTPREIENKLIAYIEDALKRADALLLLDQVCEMNTGVLTARVRQAINEIAKEYHEKLILADSRAFIQYYQNVIIKCNNYEATRIVGYTENTNSFNLEEVFFCMDELRRRTNRPVIVTCNKYGIAVEENGEKKLIPAVHHSCPIDVCGAGDACSAGMASVLCAGGSYVEAALIGNLTSGVTVRKIGSTGTASQMEILELYDEQLGGQ